jgi:hypothetical protein
MKCGKKDTKKNMKPSALNHAKLVKLLQQTLSQNDHESLAAIRKANAALDKAGHNWESYLASLQQPRQVSGFDPGVPYGSSVVQFWFSQSGAGPTRFTTGGKAGDRSGGNQKP